MNVLAAYRDAVTAAVHAALPEITAPIFRIGQLQQRNLQSEQLEARLQPPWGAYDVSLTQNTEWGVANVCWNAETKVYYFATGAGLNDGAAIQDIASFCEDRLFVLSDYLLSGAFAYTVLPDGIPSVNASAGGEANKAILEAGLPSLSGGCLTWTALIGYVPGN